MTRCGGWFVTIYPDASTVSSAYDLAGRMTARTNQMGDVTRFEYDLADNLIATTDPLGNVTRCTFDCGGQPADPNRSRRQGYAV